MKTLLILFFVWPASFLWQGPVDFDLVAILTGLLPGEFGAQVMTLLALIAAQVLLAVAVALRQGVFEWQKLPNFYKTLVIPLLMGWAALSILAKLAAPAALGPDAGYIASEGIAWVAWLAVVTALISKITESARELYGEFSPLQK